MSRPTKGEMAGWLLMIGSPGREYFTLYHRDALREWAEDGLFKLGVIKRINNQRWHSKALALADYVWRAERGTHK